MVGAPVVRAVGRVVVSVVSVVSVVPRLTSAVPETGAGDRVDVAGDAPGGPVTTEVVRFGLGGGIVSTRSSSEHAEVLHTRATTIPTVPARTARTRPSQPLSLIHI